MTIDTDEIIKECFDKNILIANRNQVYNSTSEYFSGYLKGVEATLMDLGFSVEDASIFTEQLQKARERGGSPFLKVSQKDLLEELPFN